MKCILTTILVISAAIYMVNGVCNTCSPLTGLACVDKNKFKACVNGMPKPPIVQCPVGTVCTQNAQVCASVSTVTPSCARCKVCNDAKTFACTQFNTFALCHGSDDPDTTEYTCANNLVCNVDSPNICVDDRNTGIGATCPWDDTILTTEMPANVTINQKSKP